MHRRPAPTRRAVAFRSDRSWRAPLLRFFPLQRFRLRRAIRLCHKPDDPASAIQSLHAPCVGSWTAPLLRFSARADGGYPSRLRRSDPDHAPSISCATMFRYPVERSRNLAGFFNPATLLGFCYPSQFCSCPRVRSPFGVVRPPAVCRASHPDNLVGGPVAQIPHPLHLRLTAGARRGSWVFSPRASRPRPDLALDGSILPWAYASLRSSDTGNTGMPARHSQPADPLAMDTASGIPTLMGFAGGVDMLRRLREPTHLPGRATLAHPPPTLQRSWLAPTRSSPGQSPCWTVPCLRFLHRLLEMTPADD